MENDMGINEKAYTTSEIAVMLDMGATTVRKYAQYLEKVGYEFFKSKNNARLFVEGDIMALRYLKELRTKSSISVEQATNIVIEKFGTVTSREVVNHASPPSVLPVPIDTQYNELKGMMENQHSLIKELVTRLDKQQEYMNNRLIERDRHLMQVMNERLETQRLTAASMEEANAKEKPSFFSRLFNKAR
ncbi:hypothetical protein CWR48_17285 [Oceanobacillus arenosus]|uniref:HTH merR-type domain-containing protein n=1 Tax=Oceanobacillus arenosus TaxID=1229153 RepID=A0A3D8PLM9_9BACI|nr:hypothetical protein [Oceanobacillus arenosus]RDW16397.1 hypothetical protein CWR48_17285 [Oceanobacillus arenosus]